MTKKIFSIGIIFLGYKSNFQKSGANAPPPRFLRHRKVIRATTRTRVESLISTRDRGFRTVISGVGNNNDD